MPTIPGPGGLPFGGGWCALTRAWLGDGCEFPASDTGAWAGIFLALTAGLGVLMVIEPLKAFMALSTAVTLGLTVAGIGVSTLWFWSVLRRFGLRVRFAPSA